MIRIAIRYETVLRFEPERTGEACQRVSILDPAGSAPEFPFAMPGTILLLERCFAKSSGPLYPRFDTQTPSMRVRSASESSSDESHAMPNDTTSPAIKLPHLPGPPPSSVHQPVAPKGAQLVFPTTRLTFLTSQLIRFESSPDGQFEDRASTFALNRNLPVPKLHVEHKADGGVEITTDQLRVIYDGKGLTENGLSVSTIHKRMSITGGAMLTLNSLAQAEPGDVEVGSTCSRQSWRYCPDPRHD